MSLKLQINEQQVNQWTPFKVQLLHVHTLLDTEIRKCNWSAQGDVYFKMTLTTQSHFEIHITLCQPVALSDLDLRKDTPYLIMYEHVAVGF